MSVRALHARGKGVGLREKIGRPLCLTIELRGKKLLRMVEVLEKCSRVDFADYFWSPDRVC